MAMFGLIVSGRLVKTEFQLISETQFLTTIQDADNMNHIVVFLTGAIAFPNGTAGQVYFSWPDPNAPPNWQLLGHISNEKPSAIFKISNIRKLHEIENSCNLMFGQSQSVHTHAQIGISIESIANITMNDACSNGPDPDHVTFAQKMLENFMNFTLSYTVTQNQMVADATATYVPLSAVQKWCTNFERRLQQNPKFWKT